MPLFVTPIDLGGLEIKNVLAQVLASDPGSPSDGQFWYRSDLDLHSFRQNGVTIRLGRLDQISAPTASLSLNSQKIINLLTPTDPTDATTKAYVDALVTTGTAWKAPVRAATTVAGTLASSFEDGDAIDGVTLATGDRILLKNQASGSENGLYTVNASGAPTRTTDADTGAEIAQATVFVREGTVNADAAFTMTNDGTIVLETTSLVFVQISGLGQITAGAGLTKTGNTIDVIGTAARISVAADAVDIDAAYVGQASITTLGTITTGVWNGTDVAVADGGTGRSTLTDHGVLVGRGTAAIDQLSVGATGTVLRGATGANPAFGALVLTTDVTGVLPIANGGTAGATVAAAKAALGFTSIFAQSVGDNSATSFNVDHNFGTLDVHVQIYRVSDGVEVIADVTRSTTNRVVVVFAVAPTTNQYRVVVLG